jgi:hypothetical protein
MKYILDRILVFFCVSIAFLMTQTQGQVRYDTDPAFVRPLTHPSGLPKADPPSGRSFQKSTAEWRQIIDSTWGPGLPLASKLTLFDAYATAVAKKFDGFLSLGLSWNSWDSLRIAFRSRIDSTTSRGRFASIMAQFAMRLRDAHTWALDTVVTFTPLSPGIPLLVLYPYATAEHFGAVLTALPDSTALVLRTVPNHPLGLQPGDIILGYEGVPWKVLVKELIDADLPIFTTGVGAASAETHARLRNVGNNWHLFSTIDILKYSTKDTVHLSVQPLLGLPADPMMGNEQLEIPGIPFSFYRGWPWVPTGQLLASGKLPSSNIGYVRLLGELPTNGADAPFAAAVDSFWNTDGLIIDLRWNSGGWSVFDQAFSKMFSQHLTTIEDAYRSNASTLSLTRNGDASYFVIPGVPGSIYDRPIAVLLGPTCVSMGDITAQRLRFHPMVRFFGKSTIASLGDNEGLNGYPGWFLHYSKSDMLRSSEPGIMLNRREFPIDEPVWFTPDDVAGGHDNVLEHAVTWITSLAYAHGLKLSHDTVRNAADSITVTANVKNPGVHTLEISAIVTNSSGLKVDSLILLDDGLHGDGALGDGLWGGFIRNPSINGKYFVSLRTDDKTAGTFRRLPDVALFTVLITGLVDHPGALPGKYEISQNYPNPFNPTTTIRYNVGGVAAANIRLSVYDVLGREVAVLVTEKKAPGSYDVTFDGSGLASGVYFYRLQARSFTDTKKLILIR